jgi:hypothetical protein
MDYAKLSLNDVRAGLEDVARDVQATFGGLNARQLNWRPDATQWSVAQCLEHLLAANRLMLKAAEDALGGAPPRTFWQRVPLLPRLFGPLLVRSQAPEATRKYKADPSATPAASDIAADVVPRFLEQARQAIARLQTLDASAAARATMTSPFATFINYSVLDGWRLLFTHDRRHIEQARRVTQAPGFPRST